MVAFQHLFFRGFPCGTDPLNSERRPRPHDDDGPLKAPEALHPAQLVELVASTLYFRDKRPQEGCEGIVQTSHNTLKINIEHLCKATKN